MPLSLRFFWTRSRSSLRLHVVLPFLFLLILYALFALWLRIGAHEWRPAWPLPRSMLIATMILVPVWGLCMALWTLGEWKEWRSGITWERNVDGYIRLNLPLEPEASVLELDEEANNLKANLPFSRLARYSWHLKLGGYLLLVLLGLLTLATHGFPQAADHSFKVAVENAVNNPRPTGYAQGGMCHHISQVRLKVMRTHRKNLHRLNVL